MSSATASPVVRRPRTLAARMTVLGIAVSVVSLLVAGTLAVGLIRRQSDAVADRSLASLADAAQATANSGSSPALGQENALSALSALRIAYASIDVAGHERGGGAQLARDAVTDDEVTRLLGGMSLSDRRTVDGEDVFVEARPTRDGALVLVQRRSDALRPVNDAINLLLVALAVALGFGIALSLFYALRLARPLQRTARGALRLADGHRDVDVRPEGPREVAEVGAAINALSRSLASSEARQREFLLSVSHDLRTPLTAITGYAESLADGVVEGDGVPVVGQVMLDESHRLARLVRDLLDLARLDAHTFRIDLTEVDLADLVRRAGVVWSDRCESVGVVFSVENDPPPPGMSYRVRTDPGRIRQVIDGLCENALRMTPAGRPMVIAIRPDGRAGVPGVEVSVRDGGPGLSDDDLAVAFDRGALYERYRGVRPVGTGLGLAIVHGLVTRLGGQVTAGRAPEGGASFTVWLPLLTRQTPAAVTPVAVAP
ncbi:HAMP domain-containing sensor histidine kinase [Jatrophihabitans sp. YIM 134969]